jgi:hypothetical protein
VLWALSVDDNGNTVKAKAVVDSMLQKEKHAEKLRRVSGVAVISEKTREHLTAIATALVARTI